MPPEAPPVTEMPVAPPMELLLPSVSSLNVTLVNVWELAVLFLPTKASVLPAVMVRAEADGNEPFPFIFSTSAPELIVVPPV